MTHLRIAAAFLLLAFTAAAQDSIGLNALRALDPTLSGSGVNVAQAEASFGPDANNGNRPIFEVSPATVGQPNSLFVYTSGSGTATGVPPPNAAGSESGHADAVGNNFYGGSAGVAPGVARVDNYDASYFYNNIVTAGVTIPAKIINQSFIFTGLTSGQQTTIESNYDNYAASKNALFVSGAGNSGSVSPPATSYNGIAVGAYNSDPTTSGTGPTINGRSKPDITAPAGETSYSTPLVAGAAAILVQAGTRGDGGTGTASSATDIRTAKALLLNGAVKPADWTHTATMPLDQRYGAGVLNVSNSYDELKGGKHTFTTATTNSVGGSHVPPIVSGSVSGTLGWDFNTIASSPMTDAVNHYFFDLTTSADSTFTFTGTLVCNRQSGQTGINNLDLYLYNATTNSLVSFSSSTVDNVEHIYVPGLSTGRYDLQVYKNGGLAGLNANVVSNAETYAVAYSYAAVPEPSAATTLLMGLTPLLGWLFCRDHRRPRCL
ncbi:MAG: hypothetical protein QOD99_3005 [Chthoniobacter sp.]|jgi:hypothetical protein|nr:hypothetical protein [Chthoniobacter sp.]